jgi:hypothetical protein
LDLLDMSGSKFECNAGVVQFYIMMEADKNNSSKRRPEVVGWNGGKDYFCIDATGRRIDFKKFAEDGQCSSTLQL